MFNYIVDQINNRVIQKVNHKINKQFMFSGMTIFFVYVVFFSIFLGGVILLFLIGVWFEFSVSDGVVIFDQINHLIGNNIEGGNFQTISSKAINSQDVSSQHTNLQYISRQYSNLNFMEAYIVLSSRDNSVLSFILSLWRFNLYTAYFIGLFLLISGFKLPRVQALCTKVSSVKSLNFRSLSILIITSTLTTGFVFNLDTIPQKLSSSYLTMMSVFWLILLTMYFKIRTSRFNDNDNGKVKNRTLIAYASQSGTTENIARQMLRSSSSFDIKSFSNLTPKCLQRYEQLFVIAATYGEGQAPEKSLGFSSALARCQTPLNHLNYSVLALGDSTYPKFCAFGHEVCDLLSDKGAIRMHSVQEVDRSDENVISQWWGNICHLSGWQTHMLETVWISARVINNECANKNKPHRLAHIITLKVDSLYYEAGDLLEVLTPMSLSKINKRLILLGLEPTAIVWLNHKKIKLNEALTSLEWRNELAETPQVLINLLPKLSPRVYSIASESNNNNIRLFVRKLMKNDDSLGFTSSILCDSLAQDTFNIHVRPHVSFRLPKEISIPIIMIAAGTGIAPFMSFLATRTKQTKNDNWLIFGEQHSQHDNYFDTELNHYLANGTLNRLDYAYSRDEEWLNDNNPRYVDDIISQQSNELCYWLNTKRAHLYVCGNKAGVGESVKSALKQILKKDYLVLKELGRLHFDLY